MDKLGDGQQKSHFVVFGTLADLKEMVKQDVVYNYIDLALFHRLGVYELEQIVVRQWGVLLRAGR